MSKPLVLIQAPVSSRSGYGDHARDLTMALINCGKYDIKIVDLRWGGCPRDALKPGHADHELLRSRFLVGNLTQRPDIHIHISVPNEFQPIGKYNIGITAGIETTIAAMPWIEGVNKMDLVIVPSQHAKSVFESSKWKKQDQNQQVIQELTTTTPIEVLFEGAKVDVFKTIPYKEVPATIGEELNKIPERFNFLYVGHWLQGDLGQDRKDTGMLVKVFLETFKNTKNAPGLILKTSMAGFSVMEREKLCEKVREIKSIVKADTYPNVYVLYGDLTEAEMNGLYNHTRVKAHITFTKGEGYGRPLLEASLSSKPIIAPRWSGQRDFLAKGLIAELPGNLTDVHQSAIWDNVIIKGSKWFTVNYPYASQLMKDMVKNYSKYTLNAKKLAMMNKSKFTFKKMEEDFVAILDKYVPEFPKHVDLALPNLPALKKSNPTLPNKLALPQMKKMDDANAPKAESGEAPKDEENDMVEMNLPVLSKVEKQK